MEKLYAFGEGSEFKKQAPNSFLLVKFGKNCFTRNNKQREFDVMPEDADTIIQEFESRGKDLVIDFGHSSLSNSAGFTGDAPAAGWCDKLTKTEDGIEGHVREWTPKGKERIESGEYNYHSPVLFFNDDERPNAMHSAALTNIPAIHKAQRMVAASDFWSESLDTEAIDKYKELATDVVSNIRSMKSELDGIFVSLSDLASNDEDMKKSITEFSDGLFKEEAEAFQEEAPVEPKKEPEDAAEPKSFQDVEKDYQMRKGTMSGEELLSWLSNKETELSQGEQVIPEKDAGFITDERTRLMAFKEEKPKLWAEGLVEIEAPVELEDADKEEKVSMSESLIELLKDKKSIAFADIDYEKVSMEDVEKEVKSLYDFKESTIKVLSDLGATTPESLKEVIATVNSNAMDVEARSFVLHSISDPECRVTEAMQDWAIDFYKKDKAAFKKFIAEAPVAFSQELPEVKSPDNKSKAKVSTTQKDVAILFGHDPEEVYNTD